MSDTSHRDLGRLREVQDAHQNLQSRLREMSRLSEQKRQIPADRPDALLALLERKQQILREIAEINAPALFLDTARLVATAEDDDGEVAQTRRRLIAEADSSLRLWQALVESEQEACGQWSARLERLGASLAAAQRAGAAKQAYSACAGGRVPGPRFLDRCR